MINSLVLLYYLFFASFGLSIIVFTVIIRIAMVPLTVKQSRSMKAMSRLQPKLNALKERYENDKQRIHKETMSLFKQEGVNPIGCLGPMVVQMPIFFGLFWALRRTLPSTPEKLAELSEHLYSWLPQVNEAVPLNSIFIGLDLAKYARDNPMPYLLPVLVGGSMWALQKMTTMPSSSPQQASTNRMMLWMMPVMFGFFTLSFETGLALYWIMSNVVGIIIQGFITGWTPITNIISSNSQNDPDDPPVPVPKQKEIEASGNDRKNGQHARRSNRNSTKRAKRKPTGRRNKHR